MPATWRNSAWGARPRSGRSDQAAISRDDRCAPRELFATFGTMGTTSDIADSAEQMVNESGGFPAQEQEPPGLTSELSLIHI